MNLNLILENSNFIEINLFWRWSIKQLHQIMILTEFGREEWMKGMQDMFLDLWSIWMREIIQEFLQICIFLIKIKAKFIKNMSLNAYSSDHDYSEVNSRQR